MRRPSLLPPGLILTMTVLVAQTVAPPSVTGQVRDLLGSPMSGARIVVTNDRTGKTAEAITGHGGTFSISPIDPGIHTVTVSYDGFETLVQRDVCVTVSAPTDLRYAIGPLRSRAGTQEQPAVVASASPPPAMASEDVSAAIRFGMESPSFDEHVLRESGFLLGEAFASVMTPFWRIGRAARVAAGAAKPFAATELPPYVLEALVWIVVREHVAHPNDGESGNPGRPLDVSRIYIRERQASAPVVPITPVWTKLLTECHRDELQSILGLRLNKARLIAAFPRTALTAGREIVVGYGSIRRNGGVSPSIERRSRITDDQLRRWR